MPKVPRPRRARSRPIPPEAFAAAGARAIAPAGAKAKRYVAGGENKALPGRYPIAVAAAGPFFVPVARDMLSIDSDDPKKIGAALKLVAELRNAGLRPVICDSGGGPDRVHVHCLIEDDHREHARWERHARELGLESRPDIRPPFALHRNGKSRSIPRDLDPMVALAMLTPRRKRPHPSPTVWRLLRTGEHPTRYRHPDGTPDRSAVVQAILVAFVAAGWRFPAIAGLLQSSAANWPKVMKRNDGKQLLRSSYDRAVRHVDESEPRVATSPDAREALARERARASAARWTGTGGGSRFALLSALYEVAERTGRIDDFAASTRQLAEAASIGVAAASRGLARLVADGWIVRLPEPSSRRTSRWSIPRNAPNRNTITRFPLSPPGTAIVFHPGAFSDDVARYRGVGKQRVRVLLLVTAGATTVEEIAAGLGIKPAGARKHVARLVELGLLARLPRRQLGFGTAKLNVVAEQLGVAGVGALQRSGHESEREIRRQRYLESRDQRPKNEATVPGGTTYGVRRPTELRGFSVERGEVVGRRSAINAAAT